VRPGRVRRILLLDLAAAGAAGLALLLGLGLPIAARGALGPPLLVALALGAALFAGAVAAVLLFRAVARPVNRLLSAAARLGADAPGGELPVLGPPGEPGGGLGRAAVAFERLAAALAEERRRLAAKVAELEASNRALLDARESLVRTEKLATVGRLASGIAHEVGNPLGAISGYAELARGRLEARAPAGEGPGAAGIEEARDMLARISGEARRIDAIVRDLLDFARPAALALGPVELRGPVDAALRLARVQPRFRAVEAQVEVPPGLPAVRADASRLAQVLLNLLLNAGDAMEGAGRVAIRASAGEGRVRLEVSDAGPGIPPEHLPRIFDPFFTTKAPGRGTGLGLAISHRIVESFGGEIAAANGPGGGAIFTVTLPLA
jgi:signal transduction histidine kinase